MYIKDNPKLQEISSSATIMQKGEVFEIIDNGTTYTLNIDGEVKKNVSTLNNGGFKVLTISGFEDYLVNEGYIDDISDVDNYLSKNSDVTLNGVDDKALIKNFKSGILNSLSDNITIDGLEDAIDNYINSCE
jgi:hypothetical protein